MTEPLFSAEDIERLKQRDERLRDIDLMFQIEKELRESVALSLVLEKASEDADVALEALADCDPSDVKQIIALQARIYRDRFIRRTLNMVLERGHAAERSIREDEA